MMTPPLSISARPVFRRRLVDCVRWDFADMGVSFPKMWREVKLISGAEALRLNRCARDSCTSRRARHSLSAAYCVRLPGTFRNSLWQVGIVDYPFTVFFPYHSHGPRNHSAAVESAGPAGAGDLFIAGCTENCVPRSSTARLQPGSRLPATRDLASAYRLSRATIVTAFDQLKSEGYVDGRTGSGTYVSQVLPEHLLQVGGPSPEKSAAASANRACRPTRGVCSPSAGPPLARFGRFARIRPRSGFISHDLWAQVAARRCVAFGQSAGRRRDAGLPSAARGRRRVPEHVARREVHRRPGVDRLRRAGSDSIARRACLLNPGESAWMEEPGYPGAGVVFRAVGARILPRAG